MEIEKFDYCQIAELSDIGRKRQANEDCCGHRDTINGRVVTVCDGMGGAVGGAIASSIAVNTILDFLSNEYIEDVNEAIIRAIDAANLAIIAEGQRDVKLQGMGTTCVLLIVRNGRVYIGSVGDSRVYIIQNHHASQLTKDQSYVQMLVDEHRISVQEARTHPRRNEITNALGMQGMKPATVLTQNPISTKAGDCFLLCSDGLTGMVDDERIGRIVSKYDINITQRAQMLIDEANKNGGTDNITVQIVEFPVTPIQKKLDLKKMYIIIGLVILCVVAALFIFIGGGKTNQVKVADNEDGQLKGFQSVVVSPEEHKPNVLESKLPQNVTWEPGAQFLRITNTNSDIKINSGEKLIWSSKGKIDTIEGYQPEYATFANGDFRWTNEPYKNEKFYFNIITKDNIYKCSIKVTIQRDSESNNRVGVTTNDNKNSEKKSSSTAKNNQSSHDGNTSTNDSTNSSKTDSTRGKINKTNGGVGAAKAIPKQQKKQK